MRTSRWAAALAFWAVLLTACAASPDATPGPTIADPTLGSPAAARSPTDAPPATDRPATASPPQPTGTPPPSAPDATGSTPTDALPGTPLPFDPSVVQLELEEFATGLQPLTALTHAGDGSGGLYAAEQRGTVVALGADGSVGDAPFLDLRDRVRAGGEQGLLGIAFHPEFEANGRVFVNYTDQQGDTVVAEFDARGAAADPSSERVLLRIDQPFGNHNGGMVAFGPDGYLYISVGDGGGSGDPEGSGQDVGSLLGSVLRIDVDAGEPYSIPADNPFVADDAARDEIWAIGLRNPWRFSFDRQTGDMFIADVGQNRWEEINVQPAGEGGRNYGWNVMEGPDCFAVADCDTRPFAMPVAWYALDDGNCAVSGGYVYRGQEQPLLAGAYVFADYCSGRLWALDAALAIETGAAPITELVTSTLRPAAFGEDERGELYMAGQDGRIVRLAASER